MSKLCIIEVPYTGGNIVQEYPWAFDAYREASAYDGAGVPYDIVQARLPEALMQKIAGEDEDIRLGASCRVIADRVAGARRQGQRVAMVGGTCGHPPGVVAGLQMAHGAEARIGLVWFDAHGDFNTPQTSLSGSLGGMPLATIAGLAWPRWREGAGMLAPLPVDHLILCDGRNLDAPEEALVRAVGLPWVKACRAGDELAAAVDRLAERVDMIYLHIDADILDIAHQPVHLTGEPNGPDVGQTLAAVDRVMATGLVAAYAVVSVFVGGAGAEVSIASGIDLIREGLRTWSRYASPTD